jgi:tRNA 2-thiouridine synthesizing protein E
MKIDDLELDGHGFLKDSSVWTRKVAEVLAKNDGLQLTTAHWEIVLFMQSYYQQFQHQPNARLFSKAIKKVLGKDKSGSIYLYGLFPDGPLKSANKYAGLPIPPSCI